jgi:DNA-binding HxlR family transcriptional regulator
MHAAEAGQRPRAGTAVLSLLTIPLNVHVLRALAGGPLRLSDLRAELGGPAQSTLRGNLSKLVKLGVLARCRGKRPSILAYELTPFGHDLLLAAEAVEAWLQHAPEGPVALDSATAKVALKALIGGWSSTIVRALAARPLTLTELDKLIDNCTYPALERRLSAMRLAGQVELGSNEGSRGREYTINPWLRHAIGPLSVAARCERRHMANVTAPIGRLDIEAAFLLVAPMIVLDADSNGTCQVAVEAGRGDSGRPWAGAQLTLENGAVTLCVARIEKQPESWVLGPAAAWLDAVIGRDPERLSFGGDADLGRDVVQGLHDVLFDVRSAQPQSSSDAAGEPAGA